MRHRHSLRDRAVCTCAAAMSRAVAQNGATISALHFRVNLTTYFKDRGRR